MADIPVAGIAVSLDGGKTFRVHPRIGTGDFTVTGVSDAEQPYVAHAVGPAFEGSTLPALTAPEFLTKPTITAQDSTIGVTLGGANGTWKGNPLPTLSRIFWLKNSTEIPGQNGGTLSTATGFAVDDEIIRGAEIVSTINGQEVKVTEYSLPFKLTAQQSILAPKPETITQGVMVIIPFTVLPDSVTVTQGGVVLPAPRMGGTNNHSFVPLTAEPVSISAIKQGYQTFNETWTVTAAGAEIFVGSDNRAEIRNLTESSPANALISGPNGPARYAGTHPFNPAQLATGPIIIKAPFTTGTGEPGTDIVLDLGLYLGAVSVEAMPYVNNTPQFDYSGFRYTVKEADRGKAVEWRGAFIDAQGKERLFGTPAVNVPASALVFDTFTAQASTFPSLNGYTGERGVPWTERTAGLQINGNTGRVQGSTGSSYTGPANAGMVQGVVSNIRRGSNTARRGTGPMVRATATSNVRVKMPLWSTSNAIEVWQNNNGTASMLFSTPAPAGWAAAGDMLKFELKTDANNIVHLLLNDVPSGQAATVLTGGACGLLAETGSTDGGGAEPTDFACWGSN